MGQVVKVKFTE